MTDNATTTQRNPRPVFAFVTAVPISILGGLIGLGGAEYRLPVLLGPLRHAPRQAVVLNLAISLVTIICSLAIRSRTLSLEPLDGYWAAIGGLVVGAVLAAFRGAALVHRLPEEALEKILAALLMFIGILLLVESLSSQEVGGLIDDDAVVQVLVGFAFGICVGLVSSLLGVAGGELLIPTLVFVFGVAVKPAGTASLLVSLPTVSTGVWRHSRRGMYSDREAMKFTILPMAIGSVIGAVIGGLLVGAVSVALLKVLLGTVLVVSSCKMSYSIWSASRHQPRKVEA